MKKSSVSSRGRVCLVPVECLIIRVLLRADQVINSELMSAYGGEFNRPRAFDAMLCNGEIFGRLKTKCPAAKVAPGHGNGSLCF